MTEITAIIPVAEYHRELMKRAIASIQTQTIECKILYAFDTEVKGTGYVRNKLMEQVDTKYTFFLDADDWLEPTFAETCLAAIQPNRYIYTDWYEGDKYISAPLKPWCSGAWHIITCLVATGDVWKVGGFDETLPALEDTDFWLKMTTRKLCGIHIKQSLSHYGVEGRRAKEVHEDGRVNEIKAQILERYYGMSGCCGDFPDYDNSIPVGEQQPGDVMAAAMWRGNRLELGLATGRRYPRMAYPKQTWVSPADIAKSPHLWAEVIESPVVDATPADNGRLFGVEGFAQALKMSGQIVTPPAPPPPIVAVSHDDYHPDIEYVIALAKAGMDR